MLQVSGNPIPPGEGGTIAPYWMYCPFCSRYPVIYPQNPGMVFHPGTANDGECILSGKGLDNLALWNRRF
jgi:hypothetical protein